MRVVILRTVTHTSRLVVEADTIGEAVEIAEHTNEPAWSTLTRKQRIAPVCATRTSQTTDDAEANKTP